MIQKREHNNVGLITSLLLFTIANSLAQDVAPGPPRKPIRMYASILAPVYAYDPGTCGNVKTAFSFNLGLKKTITVFNSDFDIGLEYVNQSLTLDSYFFANGYSVIYDKNFLFEHDLNINELELPILFRKTFGKETRSKVTTYLNIGWALRYFAYSSTSIQDLNTGIQVYEGKTNIKFEYPFISDRLGNLYQAALGMQFNNIRTRKALFIEMSFKLALSRIEYTGINNSNDLLIRDCSINFTIGKKL